MGDKTRCYELLNGPLTNMGLVKPCKTLQHPPIPVKIHKSVNSSTIRMKRHAYIPTMTFYDIERYDKEGPSTLSDTNVRFHSIEDYTTLDKDTTIVVTSEGCKIFDREFKVVSIDDFKSLPKNTKNVVLVFKSHGERKNYDLLDHPIISGLKRTSAMFRYIIPPNKIDSIVCYTHVKQFNSS